MISLVQPLFVGNALRIFLAPLTSALKWRLLRKTTDTFVDQNDPNAINVYEGNENVILDTQLLQNSTLYYYRAYYWDGTLWTASATASGTPNTTYDDASTDVLSVVRDRIDFGIQAEIKLGTLLVQSSGIQVLTAPPVYEDTRWPVVSVHLISEQPSVRGLGELVDTDVFDAQWTEHEGWLARVQLAIIGWSQNPDQRIALRKALRRIVVGNLPVFDANGMVEIEFSQQDVDAVSGEYPAPVYQSACTFNCIAPIIVRGKVDAITDVTTTVTST